MEQEQQNAIYDRREEQAKNLAAIRNDAKEPGVGPDMVNHPPHYTQHPSGIECIEITEHMNFNIGSAMKYLWRHKHKGTSIPDLEKAKWYIEREIERVARELIL